MPNYALPGGGSYSGDTNNPFVTDPGLEHGYLTDSPLASFGSFLDESGPSSLFGGYLQRNYNRLSGQYQGDLVNDPAQSFYSYLKKRQGGLQQEYADLSPEQRGESPNSVVARVRSVGF